MVSLAIVGGLAAFACGGGSSSSTGETLASDQTVNFAIQDDVATLDPGHVQSAVDITFTQEVFSGLYKFTNDLKIAPDIATGSPSISSDGLSYTFKMRHDAKFSNGDPITSKDVLYSWNRAAYLNDAYATVFDPVVGGTDTEGNKTKTMSGLTAPDDYTVMAKLTAPAGFWLTELALWTADIVDQKVIGDYTDTNNKNNDSWWTNAATMIGSGPFKLTQRTPKASMDYAPVSGWYGGSTGALTKVHVDVGVDQTSAVKKFESGGYDLVGPANNPPGPDDILRYKGDPTKSKELTIYPGARTTWLGFNFVMGPFQGAQQGHDGRLAFSQGIDRTQLANIACVQSATCTPATGGVITKGLKGYLGDNADSTSKFDVSAAKSLLSKWDPSGSKVNGVKLSYNPSATNDKIWGNVQSQLQANLGVKVTLDPMDFPTLIQKRNAKQTVMFRGSWGADYDHPQDWFNNLFNCASAPVGKGNDAGYCNPNMDKILAKADAEQIDNAVSDYQAAQKLMVNDVVTGNLFYGTQSYIVAPYLKGAGYNGLYDWGWEGMKILKH
jgi:oligopeptide transport system substrate-binding protein